MGMFGIGSTLTDEERAQARTLLEEIGGRLSKLLEIAEGAAVRDGFDANLPELQLLRQMQTIFAEPFLLEAVASNTTDAQAHALLGNIQSIFSAPTN